MSRFCALRRLTMWPVLCLLIGVAGCSRPAGLGSSDGTTASDQHPVPFHDGDARAPGSATSTGAGTGANTETDLPFRDAQSLPAGTLLTVRLKNLISSDAPSGKGSFEAVVDEPVVIEGNALVPRGATVSGRVESARASQVKGNRGYVQLTLSSIDVAGKDLPVQTSSLFARASSLERQASVSAITLEKGRRLTFRLSEPVYVANQVATQQASPGH
jgi:hypothetical protein